MNSASLTISSGHSFGTEQHRSQFWKLTLGCVGVVYGDIGTSPLYAFREAALQAQKAGGLLEADVLGILSLMLWALIIIVTLKYVLVMLRADNRGEGGILSLMALAHPAAGKSAGLVFLLGIAGAALFYGDGAITPAISVLSAVEGLELASPVFAKYVLPLSVLILVMLFYFQKHGTGAVSAFFGPITLLWFAAMAATGLSYIYRNPVVLMSFNPLFAGSFLVSHGRESFAVLGAVFLAVTGAEALYADLGHFGRKPIQTAWLGVALPCLALNYLGQGALVLLRPETIESPFYRMVPEQLLLPMVGLATMATIIASQAVITGAYSLTHQAIHLGLLPRLEVQHTSPTHEGQIYMPKVNTWLLLMVLLLIGIFGSSSAMASAYGVAVTGTMVITSVIAFVVIWKVWRKGLLAAAMLVAPLLLVEGVFMWSNLLKIFEGGIVPLIIGAFGVLAMLTWVRGSRYLERQASRKMISLEELIGMIARNPLQRVPGTAIFLTRNPEIAPVAMLQNIRHNRVLHEHNVLLTVVTLHTPKVEDDRRIAVERVTEWLTRITIAFGYTETPDVPRALALLVHENRFLDLLDVTYFIGRRTVLASSGHGLQADLARQWRMVGQTEHKRPARLPLWQEYIYIAMAKVAVSATDFFRIPRAQVVEMGQQVAV